MTDDTMHSARSRTGTNGAAAIVAPLCTRQFMTSWDSRRRAPSRLRAFLLFVRFCAVLTHSPRELMRNVVGAIAVTLVAVLPLDIAAQATDSLPFRAGQWGAEFSVTGSFASAGLLRFSSKRGAWLLDAGASIGKEDRSNDSYDSDFSAVRLRIGRRWYRSLGSRVLQYASLGPAVSYDRANYATPANPSANYDGDASVWSAGVFGELGAGWLVTPQLSLGAVWGGSASYTRRTAEVTVLQTPQTQKITWWNAQVGSVALKVSLYF